MPGPMLPVIWSPNLFNSQRFHNLQHPTTPPLPPINLLNLALRPTHQHLDHLSTILKASPALHILNRIRLNLVVFRLLLDDIEKDEVAGIGADGVDDGEGEFAFGQVFAVAFVGGVGGREEVHVVVADLEEGA